MMRGTSVARKPEPTRPALMLVVPDLSTEPSRRERAQAVLDRHSPPDVIAESDEERRRWVIDAMLRFADQEKRDV